MMWGVNLSSTTQKLSNKQKIPFQDFLEGYLFFVKIPAEKCGGMSMMC